MRSKLIVAGMVAGLALSQSAQADTFRYANAGKENKVDYRFTAAGDGDLVGYYLGSTASYDETLGVKVNGRIVASGTLINHGTPNFTSYNYGSVKAGDTVSFFVNVLNTKDVFSSDRRENADGLAHVFASGFAAQPWIGVPAGTFVGFEDLKGGGDLNYNDHTFVFTNLKFGAAVPEASSWAMMIVGFGAVGASLRRRRVTTARVAFAG